MSTASNGTLVKHRNFPQEASIKRRIRSALPARALYLYRVLRRLRRDLPAVVRFILRSDLPHTTWLWRLGYGLRLYWISLNVDAPHSQIEMLRVAEAILRFPTGVPGSVVEAGAFKGASTAKISLVAARVGRPMIIFDSFQGMPPNEEGPQLDFYGKVETFSAGTYSGSLAEVKNAVSRYGAIESCRFIAGWFDDTMPHFKRVCLRRRGSGELDADLPRKPLAAAATGWHDLLTGWTIPGGG